MWLNTTDTHAEVDGPGSNDIKHVHLRTNTRELDDDDTGMASRRGDNDPVLSTPFTDDIIKVHNRDINQRLTILLHILCIQKSMIRAQKIVKVTSELNLNAVDVYHSENRSRDFNS